MQHIFLAVAVAVAAAIAITITYFARRLFRNKLGNRLLFSMASVQEESFAAMKNKVTIHCVVEGKSVDLPIYRITDLPD